MLWWDDNCRRKDLSESPDWTFLEKLLIILDQDSVQCFRNSGVVKIPRKIVRKCSVPVISQREKVFSQRKISCPALREAREDEALCKMELTEDWKEQRVEVTPSYKTEETLKRVRQGSFFSILTVELTELLPALFNRKYCVRGWRQGNQILSENWKEGTWRRNGDSNSCREYIMED